MYIVYGTTESSLVYVKNILWIVWGKKWGYSTKAGTKTRLKQTSLDILTCASITCSCWLKRPKRNIQITSTLTDNQLP